MYLKFVGPDENCMPDDAGDLPENCECAFGGGNRTWVGTVEINGKTYGWADFGIVLKSYRDGQYIYFKEYWTIFETTAEHIEDPTDTDDLGTLMKESCDPELVLIDGHNVGWGKMPNGSAVGRAEYIDEDGPFAHVRDRARMVWRGEVTVFGESGPSDFEAKLFIW